MTHPSTALVVVIMNEKLKFYAPFVAMLLIIIGWSVFFYFVSPTTVVDKIGIQNSYLVVFVLAVICGFSSFTTGTFYVAVAALSAGGANPLMLGLSGGIGLCISDFAFYFFVSRGTHVIDKHWSKVSDFIKKWMKVVPEWIIYAFVFLYSAIAPVPNDIMLVTLAVGGISFKKIAGFLFAGDIIATLILSYLWH